MNGLRKPSDSPIVRLGVPIAIYRETIETSAKNAEEKAAAFSVLIQAMEPVAEVGRSSLTRCKRGQERSAAARKAKKAPHVAQIEEAAKALLAAGEPRRGLAAKIRRKYAIRRSVQMINQALREGRI